MLALTRALDQHRESPTLVVVTTALQLAAVVVVWLIALVPAAIAALTILTVKTVRAAFRRALAARPSAEGDKA